MMDMLDKANPPHANTCRNNDTHVSTGSALREEAECRTGATRWVRRAGVVLPGSAVFVGVKSTANDSLADKHIKRERSAERSSSLLLVHVPPWEKGAWGSSATGRVQGKSDLARPP